MCIVSLNDCDCSCHYMEGVMHCVPCCETCPLCGANVKWLDSHLKDHIPTEALRGNDTDA